MFEIQFKKLHIITKPGITSWTRKSTDTNTKQIKCLDYLKNILRWPLRNLIANYLQIIKTNLCKETSYKKKNQIHHTLKSMLDRLNMRVVTRMKKYN